MTFSRFELFSPERLDEAVALLKEKEGNTFVMAGGTDLLIKRRHQIIHPQTIVSLKNISGLNCISFSRKKGLTIGATALLGDVARHRTILKIYPAVAKAAGNTANVQIRNMGTVVGNLCNASPAADNAPTLLAMNAELSIIGPQGSRVLPWARFHSPSAGRNRYIRFCSDTTFRFRGYVPSSVRKRTYRLFCCQHRCLFDA